MLTTLVGNYCQVHGYHWPRPARTVVHHIEPLEFGGLNVAGNRVKICDTGHYSIHEAITAGIHGDEPPRLTRKERELADRGLAAAVAWLAEHPKG